MSDVAEFRRRARAWLAANAPRKADADGVDAEPGATGIAEQKAFQAKLYDAGFAGITWPREYGGQGLPKVLDAAVFEIVQAANLSFGICPLLTQGAIDMLEQHGSPAQQATYLEKMVSGEWAGTMNLT